MRAFGIVSKPTASQVVSFLREFELPDPAPKKNEVCVRTAPSTINIDDIHAMKGTLFGGIPMYVSVSERRPFIPGMDLSGTVISKGPKAHRFEVGDRVYGFIPPWQRLGTWSELTCVDVGLLRRIPSDWSFSQAAANAVSGAAASNTAAKIVHPQAKTVVVIGASGSIGSLIIGILSARGMNVIGVCGRSNFQMVSDLGATQVIDYNAGTLSETIDQGTFPIDVVIDCVGGTAIESQAREILGREGQILTLVGPEKQVGDRALGFGLWAMLVSMLMKTILGYVRRPRYIVVSGSLDWRNIEKYQIGLNVNAVIAKEIAFDIEEIRRGIDTVASHHTKGKIVILLERV